MYLDPHLVHTVSLNIQGTLFVRIKKPNVAISMSRGTPCICLQYYNPNYYRHMAITLAIW